MSESKEMMIFAMHFLLLGESEETYHSEDSGKENGVSDSIRPVSGAVIRTGQSARRLQGSIRADVQRQRMKNQMRKQISKQNGQASEKGVKGTVRGIKKAAESISAAVVSVVHTAANPLIWMILSVILLLGVTVGIAAVVISSGSAADSGNSSTYQAQVSEQTESYRDLVTTYCEKYGIDDYVDLCLAMIEQESGGNPPDVMQTEQSYYNVSPPIDTAEESIDCGTHELADCLKKAGCKNPSDTAGISLALQGYNFGNGYIDWAVKNYKGYTKENAVIFSQTMCVRLGYSSYGDVEYVSHVLRYYVANPETSVNNQSAKSILAELKENNKATDEVWAVMEKGASLIGSVSYSMERRQGDGRDNPEYLDCSSFVAWSFHKAGNNGIAYASTTATFLSSTKFVDIGAKDLKPGDIGLKSRTAGTGGANHVGIYCGTLKNGTKVWLHCTSESGSSLTGNKSGAMFGAYTGFTYFRRLKKWNK
jgi:cell wall-associated NlpC family hydrolase/F0F1-type ATP synthase assembly protein I